MRLAGWARSASCLPSFRGVQVSSSDLLSVVAPLAMLRVSDRQVLSRLHLITAIAVHGRCCSGVIGGLNIPDMGDRNPSGIWSECPDNGQQSSVR